MKPRVVFLSNYPVPYQLELLAAVEARGELEVTPLFLAPADPGRQWPDGEGPHARTLPGFPASLRPELRLHPTLVKELYAARPELAIVCGYSYATFQAALLALSAARVPTLLWAEVPRLDEGNLMRRLVRRALLAPVRLVRGVLAVGSRAAEAYRVLLGPKMPVVDFPYVCNLDRYLAIERPPRATFTWLFSGQLIPRKGVDVLLAAFAQAAAREPRLRLAIAGDGPEKRLQWNGAMPRELLSRVHWAGFVPWQELPALYASADALVVPSRHDGWGLVVNEAFAAGLPVLATDAVGAALDLVRTGLTGAIVEAGKVAPLAAALVELLPEAPRMGARAREVARRRLLPSLAAERLARLARLAIAGGTLS